jgi:ABC-type dipeptide/oligopeptide/nickel transport system permease component
MEELLDEHLDDEAEVPKIKLENVFLEPHLKLNRLTALMIVSDIIVKPLLALFIVVSAIFFIWIGNVVSLGLDPSQLFITPGFDAATIQQIRALWGLDLPFPVLYGIFLLNFFTGKMYATPSFMIGTPMIQVLTLRFLNTLLLILVPFLIVTAIFTLYYWKRKHSYNDLQGWRQYLYQIFFSKAFWILIGLGSYILIFSLIINGILPPGHTISPPGTVPNNPLSYALDVAWHLIGPATILTLLGIAVATHYFYQQPRTRIPPLSHGLSRIFLWLVVLSLPIEVIFIWYGTGRLLYNAIFGHDFPVLLVTTLTYLVAFGLTAVFMEGILRWGIYRHPVELHGHTVTPIKKSIFRKIPVILGLVLLFILIGISIIGNLCFSFTWTWPIQPLEASLATILPTIIDGFSIGLMVTLVGGVIGLGAYLVLRANLKWPFKFLLTFLISLFVIALFIQPLFPTILLNFFGSISWATTMILSAGVIRKISNSQLGQGRILLLNWSKTLLPLFFLYSLVGFLLALLLGFWDVGFYRNLGSVISAIMQSGLGPEQLISLVLPGAIVIFAVITFELLWTALQFGSLEKLV